MSASREKQNRQARAASGEISPKTAREAQRLKEERRSSLLYRTVGIVLILVVAASVVWNSNLIARSAAAVSVDGEKYTAAQVSFYYRNIYSNFANSSWTYFVNLDTSKSLDSQTLDESAAQMLDSEEGITWKDYFLNTAFNQMATVQNGLKEAEEEGFPFPESVQSDYEDTLETLRSNAQINGTSIDRYLQSMYGTLMTERVYRNELLRTLQYESYSAAREERLTYTDEEIEAAYEESVNDYDLVSYEALTFDGSVPEEETAAEPETAETPAETAAEPETVESAAASDGTESPSDGTAAQSAASDGTESPSDGTAALPEGAADAEPAEEVEPADAEPAETEEPADAEPAETEEPAEDAEPEGPTEEQIEAAHAAARSAAEAAVNAYRAGTPLSQAAGSDGAYTEDDSVSYSNASYSGLDLADWLFDAERKAGDADVVESGDNFTAAVFRNRFRDEGKSTVNIRHILITPEEGTLAEDEEGYEEEQARLHDEAEAKAEEVYEEWKAGEATEESFGELAKEYSADGNAADGGLYEDVTEGQMVETFNDWCFDDSREPGDTGIVETEYGFHVMYYVGDNHPRWKSEAEETLRAGDFSDWVDSLSDDADIQRMSFGMRFVV